MYHHLPHRTRHHRPYEPFDTALHHHSTRSTVHAPARQEHTSEAVQRRTTREASQQGNTALDVVLPPTMPRRHARRMPTSEELAERLTDRRRREEARDAIFNARYGCSGWADDHKKVVCIGNLQHLFFQHARYR